MDKQKTIPPAKRILFFTSSEYGQANVILAVAYELLLQNYDIHIASFAPLKDRIPKLNQLASSISIGMASAATFHLVDGSSAQEALLARDEFIGPFPPGVRGAIDCYKTTLPAMATTWDGNVYMHGYNRCLKILDTVVPDLNVCDPLMSQGLEACNTRSRHCVILSPNTFREIMAKQQPIFPTFFRYPAISSAFPYPVPWYLVPANIYLKIRLILILITHPKVKELMIFRLAHRLPRLPPPFNIWQPKNHYLVPSIPETDFPCYIAPNVIGCGPILLPEPQISKSDPDLLAWLRRGPTVLINLGSHIRMDKAMASEFAQGLKVLLDSMPEVQVLWKLKNSGGLCIQRNAKLESDGDHVRAGSLEKIEKEIASGRVRVQEWLSVDPIAVLQSGYVACSVHHGGSNSFHEALSVGVPQVVLPCWLDTFDFANRAEYLGIGVYGSRNSAPRVNSVELSSALMRVMGNGEEATRLKAKAKDLAVVAGKIGGRVKACEKIIEILETS